MGRPAADEYPLRLEGRAELLESGRLHYRTLVEELAAKSWEERLRKHLALLREAMGAQAQVDECQRMTLYMCAHGLTEASLAAAGYQFRTYSV